VNFYPHHISDFNNATRHLTRVERSVYRDAIELYYDTESALIFDVGRLERRLICTDETEKEALKSILSEFFIKTDEGFIHERCEIEIAKYRANTSAKAKAGIASAEARRKKKAEREQKSTGVEHALNSVEQTINQEPITNNQLKDKRIDRSTLDPELVDHLFEKFWNAGMVKTGKKKAKPIYVKILKNLKGESLADFTLRIVGDINDRINSNQLGFDSMHPSTYLNGERWNDQIVISKAHIAHIGTGKDPIFERHTNQAWAAEALK